jgi:hypothetical protein
MWAHELPAPVAALRREEAQQVDGTLVLTRFDL